MSKSNKKNYIKISVATFLPHLSTSVAMSSIGSLAPFLQEFLGISRTQIGTFTSVHSIGWIIMAIIAGTAVERTNTRVWLLVCSLFTGLLALLFIGISTYIQGIIIFLFLGIIFSFVNPATTKAIIKNFLPVGRATVIAIKQTGTPAGVLLASIAIPPIATYYGWKWGMFFVFIVSILAGILAWAIYSKNLEKDIEKNLKLQIDGQTVTQSSDNISDDLGSLLKNRDFLLLSFLQGVFAIGQFAIQTYIILYFVESLHFSVIRAGLIASFTQFCGIIGRIFLGLLSDYLFKGKRVPALQVIGIVTLIGFLGLSLLTRTTPLWLVWMIVSLVGTGSLGFSGTSILLRAELAGEKLAATSTGAGMAISGLSIFLGIPLFGFIVDFTQSYKTAWLLLAGLSLAATLLLKLIEEE